ncbi:transmembrane protein 65 [Caerostris extrusa]|uniref:Transmembrane protein 65 n=1 Tax=Caerostris extrusa TaxID=172846 RepID=A0AAV4U309_CAEEX|nr:transmembrane protein 65 [Caerostris extrusa]
MEKLGHCIPPLFEQSDHIRVNRQTFISNLLLFTEDAHPDPPTKEQLQALVAHSAVPFIGFGFLDNLIMIVAGDYIDTTIGVTLGISTMAAKIGVKLPPLTPAQTALSRSRWCINLGRAFGVTIGCLLGMFPLLFRKEREAEVVVESH